MSYCRWSCDDFHCDIYAYESDEGYEIHVAGNRIVGDIPPVPFILDVSADEWTVAHQRQHEFLATAQRESITLPWAGDSFCESDLEDFAARLLMLRELGYRFPDYVLDEIATEREQEQIRAAAQELGEQWPSLADEADGVDIFEDVFPVSGEPEHV